MSLIAKTNVIGPDGESLQAGEPIPESWDSEFKICLEETGGAYRESDEQKAE